MHISLDRHGRVVQAGEGTFRVPMGADEVDNTLSNPISQAEALHERERVEYATMAAAAHEEAAAKAAQAQHQAWLQNLADDFSEWATEEEAVANGGESPLLYLAAMQTMAGGMTENYSPISGYLMSQDGNLAYDRAMSGRIVRSFGQDTQSLIQSAQAAVNTGQQLVQAVTGGSGPGASPAPQASPAPSSGVSSLMSQKVAGIPVPYIAAGVLALLLLRK